MHFFVIHLILKTVVVMDLFSAVISGPIILHMYCGGNTTQRG